MASSATDFVVVWEWFNEYGRWKPYLPHVSGYIEINNKPHCSSINLGNIDGSLQMYVIDLSTMCQIRLGTGTPRQIRRALYPIDSQFGRGYLWQWEGDVSGDWHTYDVSIASVIENFFMQQNQGSDTLNLSQSTLNLPYIINFTKMRQERIGTGRYRKIRREKLTIQYTRISQSQGSNTSNSGGAGIVHGGPTPAKKPNLTSSISVPPYMSSSLAPLNPLPVTASSYSTTLNPLNVGNQLVSTSNVPFVPVVNSYQNTTSISSSTTTTVTITSTTTAGSVSTSNMLNLPIPSSGHLTRKRSAPSLSSNNTSSLAPIISLHAGRQGSSNTLSHPALSALPSQYYSSPQPAGAPAGGMWMPGNIVNLHSGLQGMNTTTSTNMYLGVPSMLSNQLLNIPGGLPVPGSLFTKSRVASRISPVVSSATNVLASPAVPGLISPTSGAGLASGAPPTPSNFPREGRISNNVPKASKKQQASGKSDTDMIFNKYAATLETPPEEEDCCICCEKLTHPSGYGEGHVEGSVVFRLSKCSHMFHKLCILAMYESSSKNGCLQCPACKTIYGEKHGNCPRGVMEYHHIPQPLPSYPPDCETVRIVYQISPGTQGPEHPHPGKRYSTRGFPRIGFLPDNEKGRKVLQLLIVAWKRRLTFTIGTSATTGEGDTVTWNEIHHKTEFGTNYSGHGYPDPNYLDNVMMELAVHGVTEDDL